MKATAKYLRQHSKEILDAVRRGEEVLITYRGKARPRGQYPPTIAQGLAGFRNMEGS